MSRHSADEIAIGFSHSTCFPACAERIVNSLCMEFGSPVDRVDVLVLADVIEVFEL